MDKHRLGARGPGQGRQGLDLEDRDADEEHDEQQAAHAKSLAGTWPG